MNILLIYPKFPDTFWSFKHALKFIHKQATLPPLGLITVAAMLPEKWNKKLVDLNIEKLTEKDIEWADCVFISGMIVQKESVLKIINTFREKGITIVAGGPLFTIEPDSFDMVDYLILNEAEITLPKFLDDFQNGKAKHIYTTTEFPDIKDTPAPMWELLNLKRYATMSIQFSRGCPFHCDFCNVTALFGHKVRLKTAEQIINELDSLFKLGWRDGVFFVDDNLIGNRKRLKEDLLPALIEWQKNKKGIPFNTEVSINLADDEEMMQLMVDAGFDTVFVGVETPDEDSLIECSKKQNKNRDMVADIKRMQHFGLQVQGGFIVGFDNDTESIFQRQIDFIQKSGIVTAMVGLLQAPPGTKLYDRLKRENRIIGDTSGDNVDGTTNIIPRMNIDTLREGYKNILESIYAPKPYYQRVTTFLREYKAPKIKTPIRAHSIMAMLESIVLLGIIGKERKYYWRLILWTFVRRPKLISIAFTLAIYGHHFRKICDMHVV
ncbi:B12-binding domain-containing radical SAM protein [bacterium]|nr:B12-binding domain-containing radical SAM protein [bacterium]